MFNKYPTVTCECEQIATNYGEFLLIDPTLHQMCNSVFVMDFILPRYGENRLELPLGKFNMMAAQSSLFSMGQATCSLCKQLITLLVNAFYQTIYVTSYLTDEKEFEIGMRVILDNFITLAPTTYTHFLQLMQDTTRGNQLLTGTFNNAELQYNSSTNNEENQMKILWKNPNNELCNCGISTDSCAMSYNAFCNYTFHSNTSVDTCYTPIEGYMISCYFVDGMLASTQECYFDMDCLRPG